jgi:hypothetical protein
MRKSLEIEAEENELDPNLKSSGMFRRGGAGVGGSCGPGRSRSRAFERLNRLSGPIYNLSLIIGPISWRTGPSTRIRRSQGIAQPSYSTHCRRRTSKRLPHPHKATSRAPAHTPRVRAPCRTPCMAAWRGAYFFSPHQPHAVLAHSLPFPPTSGSSDGCAVVPRVARDRAGCGDGGAGQRGERGVGPGDSDARGEGAGSDGWGRGP